MCSNESSKCHSSLTSSAGLSQGVYPRSVNPVFAGFVAFGSLMLFLVFVNVFKPRSKRHERGRRELSQLEIEERIAEASLRSANGEAEG